MKAINEHTRICITRIENTVQRKGSCGNKTYALFKNLVAPNKPKDMTFEDLIKIMKEHVHPKPSVIMERFKFYKRDREPAESIATYIAELKKLSRECDFKTTLQDMLRDRLVCGVRNDKIQQRLLSEATLTFDDAVKLATAVERAQHDLKDLNSCQRCQACIIWPGRKRTLLLNWKKSYVFDAVEGIVQ